MFRKPSVVSLPLTTVDWPEDYTGMDRTITKALVFDEDDEDFIPPKGLQIHVPIVPEKDSIADLVEMLVHLLACRR